MAGDIEEFLRRAAQRREGKSDPPPQQRPQPRREPQVLEAEVIDEVEIVQPNILRGDSVSEHVSEHIETSDVAERLSHLGETVDAADDRMEDHLHEYFEHDLGQLGARTSIAEDSTLDDDGPVLEEVTTSPESHFVQMLSDPSSIHDAIILSEILNRPEDRW
ncbi:MAG: hypothetical protein CMJ64_13900 [Planctomycetaceae bacterium]|jgi:hypothetical protein|nr:hypothetical protein [Planctomycetaceae bacterium]